MTEVGKHWGKVQSPIQASSGAVKNARGLLSDALTLLLRLFGLGI